MSALGSSLSSSMSSVEKSASSLFNNTSQDMLNVINELEQSHTFDIGAYFSRLFNEYGIQTTIIIASIISGLYLMMNGMAIFGLGMIVVVSFFVWVFTNYYDTQRHRGWPPVEESCPNAFYKVSGVSGGDVTCNNIYNNGESFQYSPSNMTSACQQAKIKGYDWDKCRL